jgi:alpha-ketoglutarate-dependent taurine dioxygenase
MRNIPKLSRDARQASKIAKGENAVDIRPYSPESHLPLLIAARDPDLHPRDWIERHLDELQQKLQVHGCLLFRGFDWDSVEGFSETADLLCGGLFADYGDLPRNAVSDKVYTSTHYPASEPILLHNESAHLASWPGRMCFYCLQPAQEGGETTLLDCRDVWRKLDASFRENLEARQITYVRNFHRNLDQSWESVFQESDPAKVETICRSAGIECEWTAGGSLRTRYTVAAVVPHPGTGEPVFFNQLLLFHPACLQPEVRASLDRVFSHENLPRNVIYGDGTPIPDLAVRQYLDLCTREMFAIPWQAGDMALVDNIRVSHGRNAFVGTRRIVVAMGGMQSAASR